MADRPKILDFLRTVDDDAADLALIEALPAVDPPTQHLLLDTLFARGRDAGLAQLPELYDQLDEHGQQLIIRHAGKLFRALRMSIRSPRVQTRSNTIRIIRQSGNMRLAYLAALGVHDGAPLVRIEAADTLLRLCEDHRRQYDETCKGLCDAADTTEGISSAIVNTLQLMREERQFLTSAIMEAVQTFESHLRMEVVEAAMLQVETLEDGIFENGSNRRGKLTHAMLEIFTRGMEPRFAAFAYIALRHKDLRGRVVSAISNCRDTAFFAAFIRFQWLARDPSIARSLQLVRTLAWLSDGCNRAFDLPEEHFPLVPKWVLSLGLPSEVKVAFIERFLMLDHPEANREAVWALVQLQSSASSAALERVLDCDEPHLRRIAQNELNHRRRRAQGEHRGLQSDRPVEWSRMLAQSRLTEDFDDFWQHFERIDPALGRAGGVFATRLVPGFVTQARLKLSARSAPDRARAVRMISILALCDSLRAEIFNLTSDSDPDVRAAAMMALGQIGDATSRRILERALSDEIPLVQVAAMRALDHMGAEGRGEAVLPLAQSEHAMVRAAAATVMLRLRMSEAVVTLVYMLNDSRPTHRTEALIVVEALHLYSLAPRVRELAETDNDPRVARLARHVARVLARPLTEKLTEAQQAPWLEAY